MSLDEQEDARKRPIATLADAKQLIMECALGLHARRVMANGERCALTFSDACFGANGRKPYGLQRHDKFSEQYKWSAVDLALRLIRREVLNEKITLHWSGSNGYIVLFKLTRIDQWSPLPAEEFWDNQFKDFCLRVLELCAAWEGVDEHQKSG